VSRDEQMSLIEGLRTTGAVRDFEDRPVPHDVLARVFDTARFAPSGGNQQAWRVILVEDPVIRRSIRDVYVGDWAQYLEQRATGMQPWSPLGDRAAEGAAKERAMRRLATSGDHTDWLGAFASKFDEVPVMAVVLADLMRLAATDRDLGRYTFAGGASVYPFTWSVLLAAHAEGLGGVLTTLAIRHEPELRALLRVPHELAVAAVLALGYPVRRPTHLRRAPVESFVTIDAFDGSAFVAPGQRAAAAPRDDGLDTGTDSPPSG
jgi:nitroreductase